MFELIIVVLLIFALDSHVFYYLFNLGESEQPSSSAFMPNLSNFMWSFGIYGLIVFGADEWKYWSYWS
jgi:hypothetical protein